MFIFCYDLEISNYLLGAGLVLVSHPDSTPFIYAVNRPLTDEFLGEIKGQYFITNQLLI